MEWNSETEWLFGNCYNCFLSSYNFTNYRRFFYGAVKMRNIYLVLKIKNFRDSLFGYPLEPPNGSHALLAYDDEKEAIKESENGKFQIIKLNIGNEKTN